MINKFLYFTAIVLSCSSTFAQNVEELLTSSTWNISYTILENGERKDEADENVIRTNWVKFNPDGTFETPGGMSGRNKGKWVYNPESNTISFTEKGASYKAIIEEISDIGLLLSYPDNGNFKIGLIHYIHIPKAKSNEEIINIITSGKWLVALKRYENDIVEKTPDEQKTETWYQFNADNTYQKSEYTDGETPTLSDGSWFIDDKFQLNLDASENSIYTVIGDDSKLILTTISGGYNTIEFKKASE